MEYLSFCMFMNVTYLLLKLTQHQMIKPSTKFPLSCTNYVLHKFPMSSPMYVVNKGE